MQLSVKILICGFFSLQCDAKTGRFWRQVSNRPFQPPDLNVSAPYIFSARLYPYGEIVGDKILTSTLDSQAFVLLHDVTFLRQNYTVIYIGKNGVISFDNRLEQAKKDTYSNPGLKAIAVFWTPNSLGETGRVFFRETTDDHITQTASSEVQIQYGYSNQFKVTSVVVVTWENVAPPRAPGDFPDNQRNTFQLGLILSENGSFAHIIYNRLKWHDNAVAGFAQNDQKFHNLPGSNSAQVFLLANSSNVGIPGEWLFKIDESQTYGCGLGQKGQNCAEKCGKQEFYYDCARLCHCEHGLKCDTVTGNCQNQQCARGWTGLPTCETDIDECEASEDAADLCSNPKQPDCVNTPGAYLCTCLTGYSNNSQTCYGSGKFALLSPISGKIPLPANSHGQLSLIDPLAFSQFTKNLAPNNKFSSYNPILLPDLPQFERKFQKETNAVSEPPTLTYSIDYVTLSRPTSTVKSEVLEAANATRPKISFIPLCNGSCNPNAHCESMQQVQKCVCNSGWTGDGTFCVDVNECLQDACEGAESCENTPGSFRCICKTGFRAQGRKCVDVDECQEGSAQCPLGDAVTCVNTPGGFECRCRPGFSGQPTGPRGCQDIDECLVADFFCGGQADCRNLPGSFDCLCHAGYEHGPGRLDDDRVTCVDVDECKLSPCHAAATCTNTVGSYECHCIDGYSGNGTECRESLLFPVETSSSLAHRLPQEADAAIQLPLSPPYRIFDRPMNSVYVSVNGHVTFDSPLAGLPPSLRQVDRPMVAVLYGRFRLPGQGGQKKQGGVVYALESSDYRLLTRADLNVRDRFHDLAFHATSVLVVTYHSVVDVSAKNHTFQLVLATGSSGTYAIMSYENVQNDTFEAGFLSSAHDLPVFLPFSGTNATNLAKNSNVGYAGKWIFKIDRKSIIRCPLGNANPPFCSTDENECLTRPGLCHRSANCMNTIGSYKCVCKEGFKGDGLNCQDVNLEKFNQKLGERLMKNVKNETTTTHMKNETLKKTIQKTEQFDDRPKLENFSPPPTINKKQSLPKKPSAQSEGAFSNLLVIIIPSILVVVWLVVTIVLLVVCMRKKKPNTDTNNEYFPQNFQTKGMESYGSLTSQRTWPENLYYPNQFAETSYSYRGH